MNNENDNNHLSSLITEWYLKNKRDLPWRNITDPYKIWISEVILQQTRVNQGLNYYERIVERFPDVKSLAKAPEDDVLKLWQGLGYYSRARNLHKAAKQIVNEYRGRFPGTYEQIRRLSGIGDYTGAAIASFAFDLPYAVVDGNVYRVLSRLFAIQLPIDSTEGKKVFAEIAKSLLPEKQICVYNQAIMEFGALLCTPRGPACAVCPLQHACKAFESGTVHLFPSKSKKNKSSNRYFNYLFIRNNGIVYLQKREQRDIWRNLYEFPLIETDHLLNVTELVEHPSFVAIFPKSSSVTIMKISNPMKHILSHRVIFAQFIEIECDKPAEYKFIDVCEENLGNYAVSKLTSLFLESINQE